MILNHTTSLCRVCKAAVPAQIVAEDGRVWLRKVCPNHGAQAVVLSHDIEWYRRTCGLTVDQVPPEDTHPVKHGCPFDCGPCDRHQQQVKLPVVTITSACNLDCPMCYVHNRNDDAFFMQKSEFAQVLAHRVDAAQGDLELINLTGGDPTLHPEMLEFLAMAQAVGVRRVAICTNGILLARDESLVKSLANLGARVALSFDTFDDATDQVLNGARMVDLKLRCLDLLEKHGVDTTLIPVMTKGVNDHEIGRILELGIARSNIRHIEIHTMTYTGQSGVDFDRSGRITVDEVLACIEAQTAGMLTAADFVPSPCAHPLCYQIAYLLLDPAGGPPVSFLRFMDAATLYRCLGENLYLEPSPALETALLDAINHLWVTDDPVLSLLNGLVRALFPPDRALSRADALRMSEKHIKAVYIHAHMDEETFDVARIERCCDSGSFADGRTIPVCADNVLYRETQARFTSVAKTLNTLVHIEEPHG